MNRDTAILKLNEGLKKNWITARLIDGPIFEGNYWHLVDKFSGIQLEINTTDGHKWGREEHDYTVLDLYLKTANYNGTRRGLKRFNVLTGDYQALILKIQELTGIKQKAAKDETKRQEHCKEKFLALHEQYKHLGFKPNILGAKDGKLPGPEDSPSWDSASLELKIAGLEIDIRFYDGKPKAEIEGYMAAEKIGPIVKALDALK